MLITEQKPVRTVRTVRTSTVSSEDTMVRAFTVYDHPKILPRFLYILFHCSSVYVSRPKAALIPS